VGTFGGYEMTPERDDLTVVVQRIRAAKEYIYKQERLIERLADEAKNTDDAFALLNILTSSSIKTPNSVSSEPGAGQSNNHSSSLFFPQLMDGTGHAGSSSHRPLG
jgi:hypothetical protein